MLRPTAVKAANAMMEPGRSSERTRRRLIAGKAVTPGKAY
jgi:hypothetical protein